jgi:hypothetical protein
VPCDASVSGASERINALSRLPARSPVGEITTMTTSNQDPWPEYDTLVAYFDGKLNETESEQVRNFLVRHPEAEQFVKAPLPEDDGGIVSDEELERRWLNLQQRLRVVRAARSKGAVGRRLRLVLLVCLLSAAVVPTLLLRRYIAEPRPVVVHRLQDLDIPDRGPHRSMPRPIVRQTDHDYVFGLDARHRAFVPTASVVLVERDSNGPWRRVVWTHPRVQRADNDIFNVIIPTKFVADQRVYQFALTGTSGGKSVSLGRYAFYVDLHAAAFRWNPR